ncbi:hypothetical protein N656DRAFT_795148 [Canariomyces notabilis]|uniref:AGC-kinase C-terminal domain-containing protein n=1 Tax=Canariomyces notabilis TaxID=2074819 RepID=A0AAN6TLV7_9PEZI|nr:hypothetical protein N656DRAFT_795148 [Canariomyces arenarius]
MSDESRQRTKKNILHHRETFGFPARPAVSRRCQHLIASLITDKEYRLCSKRYCMKDLASTTLSGSPSTSQTTSSPKSESCGIRDFAGRFVFPYDAEDIKAHKWFRHVP